MCSSRIRAFVLTTSLLFLWHRTARATEICGNGADDDANGFADEGCDPYAVTGVCESPVSCEGAAAIGPRKGQMLWRGETLDANVITPYGPPLTFSRFYGSQYEPG